MNQELKPEERQRVECWTRVMGYYRPVDHFNPGKQAEFEERKPFIEPESVMIFDKDLGKRVLERILENPPIEGEYEQEPCPQTSHIED